MTKFCHLVQLASNAVHLKLRRVHLAFFFSLLAFEFNHIKNPEGSLSHYEIQTALQTTYLLYFLSFSPLSTEAYLSLFVFLGRQP